MGLGFDLNFGFDDLINQKEEFKEFKQYFKV